MTRWTLLALVVALGTGVAIGLQGPLNSLLSRSVGLLEGAFVVLASGTVVTGILLLLGAGNGSLARIAAAPPVSLLGGVIGILIVIGVVYSIDRLGVAAGVAVALVANLSVAAAVDHFGLFGAERRPVGVWTAVGIALLLAGAVAIRR